MKLVANHNAEVLDVRALVQVLAIVAATLFIAPFYYTPRALLFSWAAVTVFGYSMGIFHHMYLTHASFRTNKFIEYLGTLLGTLTWRGQFAGPVQYVAMHKVHHFYSDTESDPHTPDKGIFHAMVGWFWRVPYGFSSPEIYDQYAGRIREDKVHQFMDRHVHLLQFVWGIICFLLGAWVPFLGAEHSPDFTNGFRFVIYGVFVKSFLVILLANAVDVINHRIGYRSYETEDKSTNSLLMFVVHLGGAISWHNNHHAYPAFFTVKRNWWEIDLHYYFLRILQFFGLVSQIKVMDDQPPLSNRQMSDAYSS